MSIASMNIKQKNSLFFRILIFRKGKKLCKKFKLDTTNAELRHFQLIILNF